MHAKAMVFDPKSGIANQIMLTDNPGEIKLLGGQIKGYTDKVWNPVKYKIMLHGLRLKFNKNPLRQQLLDTGSKMLFEANKNDFDWGIGCMVDDAVAKEAEVVAKAEEANAEEANAEEANAEEAKAKAKAKAEQLKGFIFNELYPNLKNPEKKITNHLGRLLMKVRDELVDEDGTNYGIDGLVDEYGTNYGIDGLR